ncbi:hypothetical protein BD626DRAFT_498171 [Schizophyllum amplum]|uniref:Uncharacterized protein n=1 Tax=Schizophyllum amplum TaxID=97359 RepID=A0A550CD16_9AGAR|nr:hypothetical protein BD626DRAFT_498171 [Auriculariopsis ampla]
MCVIISDSHIPHTVFYYLPAHCFLTSVCGHVTSIRGAQFKISRVPSGLTLLVHFLSACILCLTPLGAAEATLLWYA